jgi:hypothetical protein
MPSTSADKMMNYMQLTAEITPTGVAPAMTTLMMTVTNTSTPTHSGGIVVQPGSDEYNRWIAWITANEPEGPTQ